MRRSLEALTHLWSDGFSRDSGLKRARGKGGWGEEEGEEGMQCERNRPGGKKERQEVDVSRRRRGLPKAQSYKYRPGGRSMTRLVV